MQAVLDIDPDNAAALNYVGYTWADNNVHLDEALAYIKKAVELMPEDGYIRDSLGWVYFKMGRIEQAVFELERALQLVDSDPVIMDHLGDVYLQMGKEQSALDSYEKAIELYKKEDKKKAVQEKIDSLKARGVK